LSSSPKTVQTAFISVASEDDVREGSMFGVAVDGKAILLSKVGGKIYAVDAVCSHYNGYLPNGQLNASPSPDGGAGGHAIVCPVHKAQFEATTGKVLKNVPALLKLATHREATDLRTYEVEVVDKSVRIRV
jgi:nitrite reductase/ring-hydroxylating ferredoxin subunit